MKIQTRIAAAFTVLCLLIITALTAAIYYFANENAFQDFYTRLELRAVITAKANLDEDTHTKAYEEVRTQYLQRLPAEQHYIIKVDTLDKLLKQQGDNNIPSSFLQEIATNKQANYKKDYEFYKGIHYSNNTGNYIIIVSAVNSYAQNFLNSLRNISIIALVCSVIVVFVMGLFFSKEILSPIRRITREAMNISATSLHERVSVQKNNNDEISTLANTFNEMLSRLETAFETQNNFVSNASHELNTPLTSIIGEADYALSKNRSAEEYQQSLKQIMQQSERLKDIIKSLLHLAQSGFKGNFVYEEISVDELLYNVQKMASKVYERCKIFVDYTLFPSDQDLLKVKGNPHLLELALSNIVLNACKYSNNKVVTIALAASETNTIIIIKDQGIGIPQKDLSHIFDPFFRASNTGGTYGYGIGLPLAQNIIKLHKGSIEVSSKENEGTEVAIKIPRK